MISYSYNAAGDLLKLTDGESNDTNWNYDEYGRVTNKVDALSVEILRYAYDASGQLTNRWSKAKGNTAYTYDDAGNLTDVNYPSSTDLSFDYDAVNRLTNMVDAAGTTKFAYTGFGALESEDGPWADDTVTYGYNTARLLSSVSVARPHAGAWTQSYGYDASKRLDDVSNPLGTFDCAYNTTQKALFNKVAFPSGSYVTNKFDSLARLEETWLKDSGNTALNKHAYVYNDGNQRTKQTLIDGNYLDYSYDDIGQLIAATGKESGGTKRLHEKFGYGYDAANNLNTRTNNALVQTFNVNDVNELTSISRSGTLTVSGTSGAAATGVTVNGSSATRYSDNTFAKSGLSISAGNNTFTAIASDSYGRSSTNSITVNLPSSVTPTYDDNGNLTNDDNRDFVYDDENQLVEVRVSGDWKTTFTYDGRGRLRIRMEYDWTGTAWDLASETRYIYDGMLVIQERNADNLPTVTYTRGTDLSGTLQGAGGIGGLLARTDHQNGLIPTAYYHADGNGNVTALVNDSEAVVGRYHYDPFGALIAASGPVALDNKYRFSSKEYHANSGLYYYSFRFYDPNLQRWINRDPLGEDAGINLFQFVLNSPPLFIDPFGYTGSPSGGGIGMATPEYWELMEWLASQGGRRACQQAAKLGVGVGAAIAAEKEAADAAAKTEARADCAPCNQEPRCPKRVLDALDAAVKNACKGNATSNCNPGDSPQTMSRKIQQIKRCIRARNHRENACFGGGNSGHVHQIAQQWGRIRTCFSLIRRKLGR